MPPAKKLIEVALPLDAINAASSREKSIRHGHPIDAAFVVVTANHSPATRAVIFASLVDDPDDPNALPAFVEACKHLPGDGPNATAKGPNGESKDRPRMRLFDFIERLVTWEATTDETIMGQARELIQDSYQWQSAAPARSFRRRRQHPAGSAAPGFGSPGQRPQPGGRDDQQSHDRDTAAFR